jgi:hypothetical protein
MQVCVRMDVGVRPCRLADAGERPRLYNPRRHSSFLLFLSFAFVGVVGFAWQRPFRLAKGEGVTSILRGILLYFLAKQKFKGCIYPLHACVFSYVGVYVKIFKCRRRRNRILFLGIYRCHGFFGGWCGPFELH